MQSGILKDKEIFGFVIPDGVWSIIKFLVAAVIAVIIVLILLAVIKRVFRKRLKSDNKIQVRLVENVFRGAVIIIAALFVVMSVEETASIGRVLFQGTAVLTAVIGFAAQPVISDIICGFIISSGKPFDLGDRIELEDGTRGVVKDITMRHVVLRKMDTIDVIIPNSKMNSMTITNMSRNTEYRSINFRFSVAYGTDIEKAMEVISNAVKESEYTVPGYNIRGTEEYGPVYFMAYEDSCLALNTTVYFKPSVPSEWVYSDINKRVDKALKENDIEIPFNYMNVIVKEGSSKKEF